jgi:SAM-dependent methyltransferase
MRPIAFLHRRLVHSRRVRVLCEELAAFIPQGARVLDVGCGDSLLTHRLMQKRPDLSIQGIDVLVRSRTPLPVTWFDGKVIPFGDKSFDVVILVDVLHHAEEPTVLLREAARVSRHVLLIKDHLPEGILATPTLRFMDWLGNAAHGVALPFHYWPRQTWMKTFAALGLTVQVWKTRVPLYPWPANWVFGRSLHVIMRLAVHGARHGLEKKRKNPMQRMQTQESCS